MALGKIINDSFSLWPDQRILSSFGSQQNKRKVNSSAHETPRRVSWADGRMSLFQNSGSRTNHWNKLVRPRNSSARHTTSKLLSYTTHGWHKRKNIKSMILHRPNLTVSFVPYCPKYLKMYFRDHFWMKSLMKLSLSCVRVFPKCEISLLKNEIWHLCCPVLNFCNEKMAFG